MTSNSAPRYYNPTTGQFTQPDPSGQEANTYIYAGDDPTNNVDPTGLGFWNKVALGFGAVAGVVAVFATGGTAVPILVVVAWAAGESGFMIGMDCEYGGWKNC